MTIIEIENEHVCIILFINIANRNVELVQRVFEELSMARHLKRKGVLK